MKFFGAMLPFHSLSFITFSCIICLSGNFSKADEVREQSESLREQIQNVGISTTSGEDADPVARERRNKVREVKQNNECVWSDFYL